MAYSVKHAAMVALPDRLYLPTIDIGTDGTDINSTPSGNALTLGDQNFPRQRWGRASFDRTHRFIFSATWAHPGPKRGMSRSVFSNWFFSAIATIQSGSALTIANTNSTNVFGISEDRAQLSSTCSKGLLVRGGSVESKLNSYFIPSCFTGPPVIGAAGIGTAFGNSATGSRTVRDRKTWTLRFQKVCRFAGLVRTAAFNFALNFSTY